MAPKLDSELWLAYRTYKDDEKSVIKWIVEAARRDHSSAQSSKRLKQHQLTKDAPVSSIAIYEILPFVQQIIQQQPVVVMPPVIAHKLQNVVKKRLQCLRWYAQNTQDDDEEARKMNQNHEYPVRILRQAIDLMKQAGVFPKTSKGNSESNDQAEEDHGNVLVNRFAALNVSAPRSSRSQGDPEDGEKDTISVQITPEPRTREELAASRQQAEFLLAKMCLVEAMDELHAFLVQNWVSFSLGSTPLRSVALLTNQAIAMALEAELEAFNDISTSAKLEAEVEFRKSLDKTRRGNCKKGFFRMHDVIHKCLGLSAEELKQNCTSAVLQPISEIDYFTSHAYDNYKGSDIDTPDVHMALEMAVVSDIMSAHRKYVQTPDGSSLPSAELHWLLRGMYARKDTVLGPFDLLDTFAFAMRMEVVARALLRSRPNTGALRTAESLQRARSVAEEQMRMLTTKIALFDNYNEWGFAYLRGEFSRLAAEAQKHHDTFVDQSTSFLQTSWVCAGVEDFYQSTVLSLAGFVTVFHTNTFITLAHVYNILKEEGFLTAQWLDLEFLLSACGEEVVYRGPRPRASRPDAYMVRIMYSMGHTERSVEQSVLGSRPFKPMECGETAHAFNSRFLLWPVLSSLLNQIMRDTTLRGQEADSEELILRATVVQKILGKVPRNPKVGPDLKLTNRDELRKLANTTKHLSPLHILRLTKRKIGTELNINDFGFVEINKACIQITAQLLQLFKNNKWFTQFEGYAVDGLDSASDMMAAIAGELALMVKMKAQYPKDLSDTVFRERMKATSKIFEDWLDKKGAVGIEQIKREEHKHLSCLDASTLTMLEENVAEHGLLEDVFTSEQRAGMPAFTETTTLEDEIKAFFTSRGKERSRSPKKSNYKAASVEETTPVG
ncbi:hypothetical protein OHC33_005989 [Knufia fluminis]|uniref:DUF6604 domain-containing protein n=1 Tax=Knufia fluminis TaxID=191047 RepID=A0AAN8EJJ1_9EURO|nr:hypothetical protein OHC33_005989 [Knufia fluminis]